MNESLSIWNLSLNILNKNLIIEISLNIWNESLNILNIILNILNICNSEWLLSITEETFIGCNANMLETQETAGTQSFFTTWLHFHANFWTFNATNIQTVMLNAH